MFAALAALASLGACKRPPSADDLPVWKPSDHDHTEETARQQAGVQSSGADDGGAGGPSALVEVTWTRQCAQCHGTVGRGDGPTGPMTHARDLTDPEWQAKVSDDEMANAIRAGKGQMPKFDLPDSVVKGLVARIRLVKGR